MRIAINKDLQCKCLSVGCISLIKMLSPAVDLPLHPYESDEFQHFCVLQLGILLSRQHTGGVGTECRKSHSFFLLLPCFFLFGSLFIALAFTSSLGSPDSAAFFT